MGDSNSEFFFTTVKIQKAKNNINLLQNDQGEIITPPDEIQHEMVSFNKKLLGTCANTLASINLVEVWTLRLEDFFIQAASHHDEIDIALGKIDDNKATRVDWFNALFFKKTWNVIKHDVYPAVLEFFHKPLCIGPWILPCLL